MPRQLTIDILYDALQEAVKDGLIQDWSVDGMRVILCRGDKMIELPAIKARAYLERLLKEKRHVREERVQIASHLHCMQKRRYLLEGLLDDRLDLEDFKRLAEIAVGDLTELKRKRLQRTRAEKRGEHYV